MDHDRFDTLARHLANAQSRRSALRVLTGGALGGLLAALGTTGVAADHFGCRHVGKGCRNSDQCCSGVCKRRKCRAHDKGSCTRDDGFCAGGQDYICGGGDCVCNITTGNAPHCGSTVFCPPSECQRDADCGESGAACIARAGCPGCGNPATQNFCQRPCTI